MIIGRQIRLLGAGAAALVLISSATGPIQALAEESSRAELDARVATLESKVAELEKARLNQIIPDGQLPASRALGRGPSLYGSRHHEGSARFWPKFWARQQREGN